MFTDEPKEEYVQDGLHETKIISFLGRTTPIILQNDNGPCPLLAICNVLLLRNSLNVSSGTSEASQEKLLSLVAERLIDANSNISDKDTAYIQNQQQNIADAIDLLPRLATGIDVNIKFKRIDDFEFTRECAIFDLFDIPLYHGWIVDPQDYSTADAIGSKSYNALTGELVALEAQSVKDGRKNGPEEDCVDFVAARTATLGVPSPCLTRGNSFDGDARKGEMEGKGGVLEAVMKVSELEISSGLSRVMETSASAVDEERGVCVACEGASTVCDGHEIVEGASTVCDGHEAVEGASTACDGHEAVVVVSDSRVSSEEDDSRDGNGSKIRTSGGGGPGIRDDHFCAGGLTEDLSGERSTVGGGMNDKDPCTVAGRECEGARTGSSDCRTQNAEGSEDGGEPGEECAVHSTTVLSGGDAGLPDASSSGITSQQGELVKSFLKNNASQLTVYGLFCLQDGLKERELCVFFRNNHFSTMFKFEGELYLLVTDLGYLNQANVVWEKLNEVNGDTLFVTGNFQEFRLEAATWDRHAALSGEYISSVNASQEEGGSTSSTTSDLQLAMALQQQEFEQKDPPPKMAVGPAGGQIGAGRAKGGSLPARHEGKFRDKCVLM